MVRTILIALGALVLTTAQAQETSTPDERPAVTVPLPSGSGVFYFRSGTPGGVRIRSRHGSARPDSTAPPASVAPSAPDQRRAASEPERDGLSRLDLLLLEQRIMDALDRQLADRVPGYVPRAPLAPPVYRQPNVIVVPGAPTPDPVAPADPVAPTPETPRPGAPSIREVERSILETGLFRTSSVNFEFARAELLPISARTLDVVADVLARYPALRIEVGGHTDNVGSDAVNDPLSQRRAESVMSYLVGAGVSPGRLSAVGYGERQPVADNGSETGRALNRRVEFTVLNPEAARQETRRQIPASDDLRDMIREEIERLRDDSTP